MADSLTEQIRRNFDLIVKDQGLVLRTERHYRQYQDLQNRCKSAKANEIRLHQEQYVTRVATAHKRLIDKAGSKTRDYKHQWFGEDVFDKTKLMRRAQQQVDHQHKRRLTQIGQFEIRQTERLLARTQRENRVHGRAEFDFNKAADLRQTAERRAGSPSSTSSKRSEQQNNSVENATAAIQTRQQTTSTEPLMIVLRKTERNKLALFWLGRNRTIILLCSLFVLITQKGEIR